MMSLIPTSRSVYLITDKGRLETVVRGNGAGILSWLGFGKYQKSRRSRAIPIPFEAVRRPCGKDDLTAGIDIIQSNGGLGPAVYP